MELMQAHHQWANRPDDERFTSLAEMYEMMVHARQVARAASVSSHAIQARPHGDDHRSLVIGGRNSETVFAPTHWSFGQLATLAGAPAGYLRDLPSELAADCINFGLRFKRDIADVGLLIDQEQGSLRAATGPNYGRIWNSDIVKTLMKHVGDGISGEWRVPGIFGKHVEVTKENTTLYASDRDMFLFLANEDNRITIPNRRNGKSGSMARGVFLWNSEVGKCTFGLATFLFDYVCFNRIVWGATEFRQIKVRHTSGAPDRWMQEVRPALIAYANSRTDTVVDTIKAAQAKKIGDLDKFLSERFTGSRPESIKEVHMLEEGRPMETIFDVVTGVTAFARGFQHQDVRVELERKAGDILAMATR